MCESPCVCISVLSHVFITVFVCVYMIQPACTAHVHLYTNVCVQLHMQKMHLCLCVFHVFILMQVCRTAFISMHIRGNVSHAHTSVCLWSV